jgi:hypothetical protein
VLDDLAIAPITAQERQDLLELLDDRVGSRSTLITSQLPTSAWHAWLAEPTIADAIMDRLLHGSHTIALKGESHAPRQAPGLTAAAGMPTVARCRPALPTAAAVRRKRRRRRGQGCRTRHRRHQHRLRHRVAHPALKAPPGQPGRHCSTLIADSVPA